MFIIFLLLTEITTFAVIRRHLKGYSAISYYSLIVANTILSIYFWILFLEVAGWEGSFDDARHIWLRLNLNGAYLAILAPRLLLVLLHFAGVLLKFREGGHSRRMTNAGFITWLVVLAVTLTGTLHGRFNFTTDEVTVKIESLNPDLEGLTIALISDLHLASFNGRAELLQRQMEKINSLQPDILVNTGDFITYGWREYGSMDTVLAKARGLLGSFAVLGNHDTGKYHPHFTAGEIESHEVMMQKLIAGSGYTLLEDSSMLIKRGNAIVSVSGISTVGRHGSISYGDLRKSMEGTAEADLRLLVSHDPNHWKKEVTGRYDIHLTLAGHTHGMQAGIFTRYLKWSPSVFWYPYWNGLWSVNNQHLYVNRGLGVLRVPFRLCMPPEITFIKLTGR